MKKQQWDDILNKYPKIHSKFLAWIDIYKSQHPQFFKEYKFHDLPLAMQLGIWDEFLGEQGGEFISVNEKEVTKFISWTAETINKNL